MWIEFYQKYHCLDLFCLKKIYANVSTIEYPNRLDGSLGIHWFSAKHEQQKCDLIQHLNIAEMQNVNILHTVERLIQWRWKWKKHWRK